MLGISVNVVPNAGHMLPAEYVGALLDAWLNYNRSTINCERSAMRDDEIKSVLIFYSIDDEAILNLKFKDIWEKFVIANIEGVSCRNVFHFEMSPEELSSLINSKNIPPKILKDIKSEFDLGANIMFVNPVVGEPIDGFMAHNFLSH